MITSSLFFSILMLLILTLFFSFVPFFVAVLPKQPK